MPIGPFDRRKKRSRCVACSKRHLKCSGDFPCLSCSKKGLVCEYVAPRNKTVILVERGKQQTQASFAQKLQKSPALEVSSYYFYYFDVFLRKNRFNSQSFTSDVARLTGCSSGSYLMDAVLALGAMEAIKLQAPDVPRSQSHQFALKSYLNSVSGLRHAINESITSSSRNTVLWTTLVLGLFELMVDSTGQGWVQHIVHGTSSALLASGPIACHSGLGNRFFREIKIFEVCRAIVFNQPTFLARPEWMSLSSSQAEDDGHPLDTLLDIIVMCSSLRVKAIKLIESVETSGGMVEFASHISIEGFRIRTALDNWHSTSVQLESDPTPKQITHAETDEFMLLARIFHAAASIYLSGVFDYEIAHWQTLGIVVSTLSEEEIQIHLRNILELGEVLLNTSDISPLLLLFPLRVAGARSGETWQQERVKQLLERVEGRFSVAGAFKTELGSVWERLRLTKEQMQEQTGQAIHITVKI